MTTFKQEIVGSPLHDAMQVANRELESMDIDDLRSFYFDRRVDEILKEWDNKNHE